MFDNYKLRFSALDINFFIEDKRLKIYQLNEKPLKLSTIILFFRCVSIQLNDIQVPRNKLQ